MPAKASLRLDFSQETCPGALFEVPQQAVDPGEIMTLRIWGATEELLAGYELIQGTLSLGAGTRRDYPGQTICRYIDWAGENTSQQLDYPITGVTRVTAFSPLICTVGNELVTFAPQGTDVTAAFRKMGHSCLAPAPGVLPGPLYGATHCVASRPPYALEWAWTAPADPAGGQWFFLYRQGALKNRFALTMSEEPDDASLRYVDVKIRVIDRHTAGAVLGARVWLDGVDRGLTDDRYGFVKIRSILSGAYPVRVTKDGYTPTDEDSHADNDTVTITPDGSEVRVLIGDL
jgi:hypothetical protein